MATLVELLLDSVERHPDRLAVRLGPISLTYTDLLAEASAFAGELVRRGLRPGDRVGLVLPNGLAFPVAFYGAQLAGCAVVPMNTLLKRTEVDHYLQDSGAALVVVTDGDVEATAAARAAGVPVLIADAALDAEPLAEPVRRAGDETAVLLYTSGTTGQPKGADLTHDNLAGNALVTAALLGLRETDVMMGCLPLFHVFGLTCALNATLSVGGCLTMLPRFDPADVLTTVEGHGVTVFQGVPTMYNALLQLGAAGHDTATLRVCVSGGAAMPVEVLRSFEQTFDCTIVEGYGLSETSPVVAFNHLDAERKPGSIGTPVAGVRMRLVDAAGAVCGPGAVGEIEVQGPNVMRGYWRNPEATRSAIVDGWFRTGDLATVDDDGFYTIVDRKKDMLIRGGYNVYPREVEEVLYTHPDVVEAAVIGLPDEHLGEEVGAAVALRPGSTVTPEELREFVRGRLAAYKYPRQVWLVDELPKGPTGKILRREVKAPLVETS